MDDIIVRRVKDVPDRLFQDLNNYNQKLKFTVEVNPTKFLDTDFHLNNGQMKTKVHRKETKLPVSWNSKIPKQYKRNMLLGDLHRAKKISSNFVEEKKTIKTKYIKAEFPLRFINSIVNSFEEKEKNQKLQQ